jgi:hypothetical protein
VEHDVSDVGQAQRGVIVAQVLGQPFGAHQVDHAGGRAQHRRARALHALDHPAGLPTVAQTPQIGDVTLDLPVDLAELGHRFRVVLQILELASNRLLDVVLQPEHVADVAVDRFVPVACHDDLQELCSGVMNPTGISSRVRLTG